MSFISNVKKTFKFKYQINYILIIAFLAAMMIFDSAGGLTRSVAGLLVRIAYSIILAISLNLVVGFLVLRIQPVPERIVRACRTAGL